MTLSKNLVWVVLTYLVLVPSAIADGFFLAAEGGVIKYSSSSSLSYWGDDFPMAGSIKLGGGYNFNQYFAIEAKYSKITEVSIETGGEGGFCIFCTVNPWGKETLESSIKHVAVVGTLPIGEHIGLFIKLGQANTSVKYMMEGVVVTNGPHISREARGSSNNLMYGIGSKYIFNEHWEMHVQYENFGNTEVGPITISNSPTLGNVVNIGLSAISAGCAYKF